MEPGIVLQLKRFEIFCCFASENLVIVRYFQAGGNPEQVVELLSGNYHAIAQQANLLAEWLIMTG